MDAKRRGRKRQIKNDIKRPKKRTRLQGQETVDEVDEEPETLCCREEEISNLEKILSRQDANDKHASVFISGPPGTGKTAAVKIVLNNLKKQHKIRSVYVNCLVVNRKDSICKSIYESLSEAPKRMQCSKLLAEVENYFRNTQENLVIVLDEVDYIQQKDRSFLCAAFAWPSRYAKISFAGIANSLNITDLLMPSLKEMPKSMVFTPYTDSQLQMILSKKMADTLDTNTIELCARKIAATTGDVRRAIQVARKSIEATKNSSFHSVLGTLSNVYSSPAKQRKLPFQQKILLAVLLQLTSDFHSSKVNTSDLLSAYCKVCDKLSIPPLDSGDLRTALALLESNSFVETSLNCCQLLVERNEAQKVIADSSLLSQISSLHIRSN